MTTAHHLRLIDGMRTRDFPAERLPSGSGVSGPGYHTAVLHAEDEYRDDDEAGRLEHGAQCLAEHDALLTLLSARWGDPQTISLWSAQERMSAGETTFGWKYSSTAALRETISVSRVMSRGSCCGSMTL